MPSLQGWLTPSVKYEAEDNRLTIFVPNLMALEYCRLKQESISEYFLQKYGLQIKPYGKLKKFLTRMLVLIRKLKNKNTLKKF
jgi:DNA polymerase-3 subunit alpha (Gram-positive type)